MIGKRLRLTGDQFSQVDPQCEARRLDAAEQLADRDLDAELLAAFARQPVDVGLAELDLATRKLPLAGEIGRHRPPGGQHAAAANDRGADDDLHNRKDCQTRRLVSGVMDMRLELVPVPVSDVDRAKAFYVERAGFNADQDHRVNESLRFVQLTPPGSACSIAIGQGLTAMQPGSLKGLQVVVADADAARADLASRGVEVSDVQEFPWGRFVFFADPDGNEWSVQQIVRRQ
jgi:predicted enzyme related to lactoylglutathione lyase